MRLKLLLILFTTLAFWGCTKGEDPNVDPANFSMDGLHDVTLISDSLKSDTTISINVVPTSGKAEEISLSIGELPAGVQATFSPDKGVPPFTTTLLLSKVSSTTAGTYPVSIHAKSASFSNSGTINLTIPELNGWTFDGIDYEQFFMPFMSNQGPIGNGWLFEPGMGNAFHWNKYVVGFGVGQPYAADGVYNYKIITDRSKVFEEGEISFWMINIDSSGEQTYRSAPSATRYAVIKVSGGKYSINVPPTEMYENGDTNKPMKILSVNAWMK